MRKIKETVTLRQLFCCDRGCVLFLSMSHHGPTSHTGGAVGELRPKRHNGSSLPSSLVNVERDKEKKIDAEIQSPTSRFLTSKKKEKT